MSVAELRPEDRMPMSYSRKPKILRCGACAGALNDVGVCRRCHPEATVVMPQEKTERVKPPRPEPEDLVLAEPETTPKLAELPPARSPVRVPSPAMKKCPACGGRINLFDGRCHRCDKSAPTEADAKPVVRRSEPAPEQPRCKKCGDPFDPGEYRGHVFTRCETCREKKFVAKKRWIATTKPKDEPAETLPMPTPDPEALCHCGRPLRHRGPHWGSNARNAKPLAPSYEPPVEPEKIEAATREAEVTLGYRPLSAATCRTVRLGPAPDLELAAIAMLVEALSPLEMKARRRALLYIVSRFDCVGPNRL